MSHPKKSFLMGGTAAGAALVASAFFSILVVQAACTHPATIPTGFAAPCPVFSLSSTSVTQSQTLTLSATPQAGTDYIYTTAYVSQGTAWNPYTLAGNNAYPSYSAALASLTLSSTQLQTLSLGTHYAVVWDWLWDPTANCYKGPGLNQCNTGQWRVQSFSLTSAATPTPTPTPNPCLTSTTAWQNQAIASQTDSFEVTFDATPNANLMDGDMGLSLNAASAFTNLAAIIDFGTTGNITARNGGVYQAASTIPYAAGSTYHFRLDVNIPNHTYSAYVTPPGGTEKTIGLNYAFRTEQAAVSSLNNFALVDVSGSETVCNLTVSALSYSYSQSSYYAYSQGTYYVYSQSSYYAYSQSSYTSYTYSQSAYTSGTNWYVDPNAAGSSNGTSWANAWKSMGAVAWASVHPGDRLYISGGSTSQTYSGPLGTPSSGVAGSPVTISVGQDAGHNGTVIFDGGGNTSNNWLSGSFSYVTITGNVGGATHLTVQNFHNYVWLCTGSCPSDSLQYIYFPNMWAGIHLIGGNNIGLDISHIEMHKISNTSNGGYDDLIQGAGAAGGYNQPAHAARIHDSKFYIPAGNTVGGGQQTTTGLADPGFGDDGMKWPNGLDFYNNYVKVVTGLYYGTQHADVFQMTGSNQNVYNNVFEDVGESIAYFDPFNTSMNGAAHDIKFYNNLFVETNQPHTTAARGMDWQPEGGAVVSFTNFIFANNTFVDWTDRGFQARFNGASSYTNSYAKNNVMRNGNTRYVLDPGVGNSNNVNGNVAFVSYTLYGGSSNDLHLQSTDTVAKGQGIFLPDIPAVDKDGNPRPSSGAWSAGAYQ